MPTGSVTSRNAVPSTFPLEEQRFFDLSPADRFFMLGQNTRETPLITMLSAGLSMPTRTVREVEFKTLLDHRDYTEFLIQGDDGSGSANALTATLNTISMTDINGNVLNANLLVGPNDIIHIPADQTNQTVAAGTVGAAGEDMRIVAVNAAGDIITVERDIGGNISATTQHVQAGSGNTLEAWLMGPLIGETDEAREVINHGALAQLQYMPEYEEGYEASDTVRSIQMAGGDPFTHEQLKKLQKIKTRIEYDMLFSKKYRTIVNRNPAYKPWGLIPFMLGDDASNTVYTAANDMVTGDATQRIWDVGDKENFNINNFFAFLEVLYSEGSDRKVMFAGPGFFTMFLQELETYLTLDFETSTGEHLGLKLKAWSHPYSNEPLIIMPHGLFKGPASQDALVVDLLRVRKAVFPGMDLHIWKGRDGVSLSSNKSRTLKHAWNARIALDPLDKWSHAWIKGVTNDDGSTGGRSRTVGTPDNVNI